MAPFRGSALTIETVESVFKEREWQYRRIGNGLLTSFERVVMVFAVDEERETMLVYVPVLPGKGMEGYHHIPPTLEHDACVYLMARNFRLLLGGYSRDHLDGEIRFTIAVPVSGTYLSNDQVEHAILASVGTVTRDAGILNALLTGEMQLHQALTQLTRGDEPPSSMVV